MPSSGAVYNYRSRSRGCALHRDASRAGVAVHFIALKFLSGGIVYSNPPG